MKNVIKAINRLTAAGLSQDEAIELIGAVLEINENARLDFIASKIIEAIKERQND